MDEALSDIEKMLSRYHVEIKQIQRSDKDDIDDNEEIIKVIGQYDKIGFPKNELIKNLTAINNIKEIIAE